MSQDLIAKIAKLYTALDHFKETVEACESAASSEDVSDTIKSVDRFVFEDIEFAVNNVKTLRPVDGEYLGTMRPVDGEYLDYLTTRIETVDEYLKSALPTD